MRKYRRLGVLLLICSLVLLTACQNPLNKLVGRDQDADDVSLILENGLEEKEEDLRETLLYYRDDKGILIPLMKKIPWEEGIAKAALKELVDNPEIREDLQTVGLMPTLPNGTDVLGMSINEGLSKVDFNDKLLTCGSEAEEQAMVKSIVYTLTEFEAIDKVQILVNGKVTSELKFGTKVNAPMAREHINLTQALSNDTIPVVVYYKTSYNGEDSFFVPVTKGLTSLKADVKSVLNLLLEGAPEGTDFYSELPDGVTVNDVYVKDGIAYIEFSEEITRIPENLRHQQSLVYEIGLTLKEVEPTISQVRLLSKGKEIDLHNDVKLNLPVFSNHY